METKYFPIRKRNVKEIQAYVLGKRHTFQVNKKAEIKEIDGFLFFVDIYGCTVVINKNDVIK